jgi:glycerol-3-phosphate dehydrogenase (NAD(P)+)
MGTALAVHMERSNPGTVLLATEHDTSVVDCWRSGRPHPALGVVHTHVPCYEPDQWDTALRNTDILIAAVSTHGLGSMIEQVAPLLPAGATIAIATKGWQSDTLESPSEVAQRVLGDVSRVVSIAGPGLAPEIAIGAPTMLVCAGTDPERTRQVARSLRGPSLSTVVTDDVVGAETGSAYKNVVAIAVGVCEGFSERMVESASVHAFANARAGVFAQGLIDMVRLAESLGGRADTIIGLSGAGDLYVTCLGGRNGRFGRLLGAGQTAEQARRAIGSTVEGVPNCKAALAIAQRLGINLPTARAVEAALAERLADAEGAEYVARLLITGLAESSSVLKRFV